MIEDAKRSIAFLCPVCRQPVILERTVFQLAASGSRLPCPCGKSALTVSLMGDQVRLTVPCLFCEQEHTVSCSTAAFLQEKTLAFSCANSGLDCCYVGEEASVFAAMRRLEETVDVLESEAGALGPAFPMYAGSATVSWEGLSVFLTHGHRYGPHNPPPIGAAQVLLSGHTHIPSWQWVGDLFCANPGSVSLPRGGSPHSCLLYEDGLFRWLTLEGETFHWEVLPPPSKENILSD